VKVGSACFLLSKTYSITNISKCPEELQSGGRLLSLTQVNDPYCHLRALIRMSWHPSNLKNLLSRKQPQDLSRKTVFQQRWTAKRELRAYHVPNITEKQMLARHFQPNIPVKMATTREKELTPPIQALAFGELERRADVVVFRSHFAKSIFQARHAVVNGFVKINGEKVCSLKLVAELGMSH
jgi:ribosomal protein S4